jgi:ATP-dependent DNA ligase
VLDGEISVLLEGRPQFAAMLQREQATRPARIQALMRTLPAVYVVFDVLYRDGLSVMELPLSERREILAGILSAHEDPRLIFSQGVTGDGLTFFREACRQQLEGVVAKRLSSRYLPGKRTDAWQKIKRTLRVYCAVLGYQETGDGLKSLLVAVDAGGELRYAGKVGSGWNAARRDEIHARLRRRIAPTPILPVSMEAVWVEPGLYCTVDFLEWTEGGELRAPVFVELLEG